MLAIIGLGNPGSEYDGTRHNVGFAVLDAITESLHVRLRADRGEYLIGSRILGQQEMVLVKPLTYMNNSGLAVKEIVQTYNFPLSQALIVVDDFHLPLGTIRLRMNGTDGGHNGLYSIIYHLQSGDFPRLRCGIGGRTMPVNKKEMARYVLSPFDKDEQPAVKNMIERARDAAIAAATENIESAMSRFNGVPT